MERKLQNITNKNNNNSDAFFMTGRSVEIVINLIQQKNIYLLKHSRNYRQ